MRNKILIRVYYIDHTEEFDTLPPEKNKFADLNETSKDILPSNILLDITIDDITKRANLTVQRSKNEDLKNDENSILYKLLGFMGKKRGDGTCNSCKSSNILIFWKKHNSFKI